MEVLDSRKKNTGIFLVFFILNCFSTIAVLSPKGVNYEVQALMAIKESLSDVRGILDNWDSNAVDPCSWAMITCSSDNLVISLGAPSQNLSGTLSPRIGNLTNLQVILLQNNNITGKIPEEIRHLLNLRTLDLSNNLLIGRLPFSLSLLPNIQYMRLNNNSFSGALPASFANMTHLSFLDLSYNNLSGPVPRLSAKTFSVIGNELMCRGESEHACYASVSLPTLMPVNVSSVPPSKQMKAQRRKAAAFGLSVLFLCMAGIGIGFLWWSRYRRQRSIDGGDGDVEGIHVMTKLGNLRNFQFKELQASTDHFSSKNLLGKGGFGNVYRGRLRDGMTIAVKRLNDGGAASGAAQFRTEVEMISLAVHRNLLKLYGFCVTSSERLLVYPYMCNGSVASRLRQKPVLDWRTRKKIAVGAARGLLYLHEQCDPKIIHRDVKAANVLLDECYDAVVGDFGLAKLLDHQDTHVTTAVRGTVGHIAPEYLSTGQSSEKTDVYGFGILLVELVTGKRAVEFGKCAMLDWVKRMNEEKRFDGIVDRDLNNEYDGIEVEELIRVAILCTQGLPGDRPKMADVVRMLEGDGVAERWEASQKMETAVECSARPAELCSSERYSDLTDDSSYLVQPIELSGPR